MKDAKGLIIVTDLDGTLLDGDGRVPENNLLAIERFKAAGGRFTIASGRYGNSVGRLFPEFREYVNAPTVFSNGAVLFDEEKGEPIAEITGKAETMRGRMEDVQKAFPKLEIFPVVMRDGALKRQWWSEVADGEDVYKILFSGETELLERAREYVDGRFPGVWAMSFSCPTLLELVLPEATKGKALGRMKDWFAAKGETVRVIAVGDYENDLDLLLAADVAACPENSIPAIKAAARIRLCDHSDGCIADLVSRILDTNEIDPFIKGE